MSDALNTLGAAQAAQASGQALVSEVDTTSADFKQNKQAMQALVSEWRERVAVVKAGGGADAIEKHKSRGKLTARERIEALIDPGTAFLEMSTLAAWEMYEGAAPGAG